jgi:allophanate hydrolase
MIFGKDKVLADPIRLNSRLGTYTNFVNLLDLRAAAVPAALHRDGTPFGITFITPGGQDALAASLAKAFHALTGVAPGAQAKLEAPVK